MLRNYISGFIILLTILKPVSSSSEELNKVYSTGELPGVMANAVFNAVNMCKTRDGNLVMVMEKNRCKSDIQSYRETHVIKLNPKLETIWSKIPPVISGPDKIIAAHDSGTILISETDIYRFDKNGDTLWCRSVADKIGFDDIFLDNDTTLIAVGGPSLGVYRFDMQGKLLDHLDTTGFGTSLFVRIAATEDYYYVCDEDHVRKINRDLKIIKEIDVTKSFDRYTIHIMPRKSNGFILGGIAYNSNNGYSITLMLYDSTCTLDTTYQLLGGQKSEPKLAHMGFFENDTIMAIGSLVGADSTFFSKFHPSTGWHQSNICKLTIETRIPSLVRLNNGKVYLFGDTDIGDNSCNGYVWVSIMEPNWKGVPLNIKTNDAFRNQVNNIHVTGKYDLLGKLLPSKYSSGNLIGEPASLVIINKNEDNRKKEIRLSDKSVIRQ
jgi:hypothetical protein